MRATKAKRRDEGEGRMERRESGERETGIARANRHPRFN